MFFFLSASDKLVTTVGYEHRQKGRLDSKRVDKFMNQSDHRSPPSEEKEDMPALEEGSGEEGTYEGSPKASTSTGEWIYTGVRRMDGDCRSHTGDGFEERRERAEETDVGSFHECLVYYRP